MFLGRILDQLVALSGKVLEALRGEAWLEEAHHQGCSVALDSLATPPSTSFLSADVV